MEASLLRQLISTGPAELLIASIWQGLLLTALAWAALKLAPGLRASTRFTLWLIAFVLAAFLPFFSLGSAALGAHPALAAVPQAGFSLHLNAAWAFALEGLWVAASLVSLGRLAAGGWHMRTLFRSSTPVPFDSLDNEIQSIVARAGSRPVEVRLSDGIDAPSVAGFFHPAVIVPRSLWGELTASDVKQIILHEMAHLDRGDDWTNLLQKLLRALCPLNPALFWAERHLCLQREQACDDAVLDAAGNARAYATCLTKLAESRVVKRAAALAPGMWKRHSELAGRVENILHRRRSHGPLFVRGLVTASLVASLAGVFLLQQCPGIVTFAGGDAVASASLIPATEASSLERGKQHPLQPRLQEASFHPAMHSAALQLASAPAKPRAARKVYAASLRFVELRSSLDGEGFTLIFFTVEAPHAFKAAKQAPAPKLLTPDNWIVFQI
jgi:beta-lactamase regulating signal transducer with metallopeptidase domain